MIKPTGEKPNDDDQTAVAPNIENNPISVDLVTNRFKFCMGQSRF